jgi:DNA polymerase-3 subunit beta
VIIPLKALHHLQRLVAETTETVTVELSKNHARFTAGPTTLTTKLIEGPFPNYEQVLPKQNNKMLRANRDELTQALDRVSIFSDSLTRQVKFSISENKLRLIVQTPDQGEANEEIGVTYTADDLDIGYNATYILRHPAHDRFRGDRDATQHARDGGPCRNRRRRRGERPRR